MSELIEANSRSTAEARVSANELDRAVESAADALLKRQRPDGHWVYELEADVTIPAEYVLLRHYRGEPIDAALEAKVGNYLRRRQGSHGGWPLFHDGDLDISASVKAYFALKVIGDDPELDHMRRAREAILARGGAERSNVFTRILLALYGVLSWRAVPVMPVEIMLLPPWFPFHVSKISYWARTVLVPLLVVQALKPPAINPTGISVDELFLESPRSIGPPPKAPHQRWSWFLLFRGIDAVLRMAEPLFPKSLRKRAIGRAADFVTERLNGEHGLGAIFPAMVNCVMMFDALGYAKDHHDSAIARKSIEDLLIDRLDEAYCQPCVSPVWDTALTCHALLEVGGAREVSAAERGLGWLALRQVMDVHGDWSERCPGLEPGGWPFQYENAHYPDLDDTAVVVMALDRAQRETGKRFDNVDIDRARAWIVGLQSANGGWAAFDADNTYYYLNNIPFADHGALLDPPTEDVTARCVSMLAQLGAAAESDRHLAAGVDYLRKAQRADGSWFGRWGINYIYGTWSALCALDAAGIESSAPEVRRAVEWLLSIQNGDGGWGESGASYKLDYHGHENAPSTASQTAWALLALMAAGEGDHPAVVRGIGYLLRQQGADGLWDEKHFTGVGFPRVFYLRYHGYSKVFPLWAIARYRNITTRNSNSQRLGM